MDRSEQAKSFGTAADQYERSRPTYPAEAVAWLVPPKALTVVDLGAGTGKFTRSLVGLGLDVIAVEPDPVMLGKLGAALPSVRRVEGTAEAIPLPDETADVVTVAQAWHWVDQVEAPVEVARVLRAGGTLGLVWNQRDERVDWVRELNEIAPRSNGQKFLDAEVVIGAPFGKTERFEVDWSMPVDADRVIGIIASGSDVFLAPETEQDEILGRIKELLATHPQTAGRETFELPYRTFCYRARLRDQL